MSADSPPPAPRRAWCWRGGPPRSATHHRSSQDETESHGLFASLRGNRWTAIFGSAAVQPSAVSAGMPLLPAVLLARLTGLASEAPEASSSGVDECHLLNLATRAGISRSRHV